MENIYPPPFSVNHGQCLAAMQSAMRQKEESLLTLRHCLHAFPSRDNIEFSLWVKTPVLGGCTHSRPMCSLHSVQQNTEQHHLYKRLTIICRQRNLCGTQRGRTHVKNLLRSSRTPQMNSPPLMLIMTSFYIAFPHTYVCRFAV